MTTNHGIYQRRTPRTPRQQARYDQTCEEILTVARAQLAAGGPGNVSLRTIAKTVGMTAPGLYRYIGDHAALMAVLETELAAAFTETLDEHDDKPAALFGWCLSNPGLHALLFARPDGPGMTAVAKLWAEQ